MEAEAEGDPRIHGSLLFLHCPLQSSFWSIPLLELKDLMCLAALLWFGMLVGKWQEQELLPAPVPSYCRIREPMWGESMKMGKKAETEQV